MCCTCLRHLDLVLTILEPLAVNEWERAVQRPVTCHICQKIVTPSQSLHPHLRCPSEAPVIPYQACGSGEGFQWRFQLRRCRPHGVDETERGESHVSVGFNPTLSVACPLKTLGPGVRGNVPTPKSFFFAACPSYEARFHDVDDVEALQVATILLIFLWGPRVQKLSSTYPRQGAQVEAGTHRPATVCREPFSSRVLASPAASPMPAAAGRRVPSLSAVAHMPGNHINPKHHWNTQPDPPKGICPLKKGRALTTSSTEAKIPHRGCSSPVGKTSALSGGWMGYTNTLAFESIACGADKLEGARDM